MVPNNDEVRGFHGGLKTFGINTWRPMDNALVKGKAHQAREIEQDLFMTHREVLMPTERQRLTRKGEIVGYTCVSEVPH